MKISPFAFVSSQKGITMLRIGQIEYANCTPIFTALRKQCDCQSYQFVGGVPARLNAMLGAGEIDVCPSSSIEYGKSFRSYVILPELSISSIGAVKSVFLFSSVPVEQLNGKTIGLTAESDTSVNLLKILLIKSYGLQNSFERTSLPLEQALSIFPAILLIGDSALKGARLGSGLHVYDLGELWHRFTGLPFVFALWIARREAVEQRGDEILRLMTDLVRAKRLAYESYEVIAETCREREWLDRDSLVDYWRTISYELSPAHLEGVGLFFKYATELGLLPELPDIRLLGESRQFS